MIDQLLIPTRVISCEERKERVYVSGTGEATIFTEVSKGWYVFLEGSYEALNAGSEDPGWRKGDQIEIIVRRKR